MIIGAVTPNQPLTSLNTAVRRHLNQEHQKLNITEDRDSGGAVCLPGCADGFMFRHFLRRIGPSEDSHDRLRHIGGTTYDLERDSDGDSENGSEERLELEGAHHIDGFDDLEVQSDTASEGSTDIHTRFYRALMSDDDGKFPSYRLTYTNVFGEPAKGSRSFHFFLHLPPEIQHRVWQLFCPELAIASRVYRLSVSTGDLDWPYICVYDALTLALATREVRRVLSVHRASRDLAMRVLPDTLPLDLAWTDDEKGILRFNRRKDVIELPEKVFAGSLGRMRIPNVYLERVENLSLDPSYKVNIAPQEVGKHEARLREFHNLRTVYFHLASQLHTVRNYRWMTSHRCHRQAVYECVSSWPTIYCWPGPGLETPDKLTLGAEGLRAEAARAGWELLPMVVFSRRFGWEHYGWIHERAELSDDEFVAAAETNIRRR